MNPVLPPQAWARSDTCAAVDSMVTDLYQAPVCATGAVKCNWA